MVVFVDVLYESFIVSRLFHDTFLVVVVVVVVVVVRVVRVVVVRVVVRVTLVVVLSFATTGTHCDTAGTVADHILHGPIRIVLNFHEVSIESHNRVSFTKASVSGSIQIHSQILGCKPRSKPFWGIFTQRR